MANSGETERLLQGAAQGVSQDWGTLLERQMKLYQKAKGDLLKAKAYDLLKAAQGFIDKGILQWW